MKKENEVTEMHDETCIITRHGDFGPMTVDLCKLLVV